MDDSGGRDVYLDLLFLTQLCTKTSTEVSGIKTQHNLTVIGPRDFDTEGCIVPLLGSGRGALDRLRCGPKWPTAEGFPVH